MVSNKSMTFLSVILYLTLASAACSRHTVPPVNYENLAIPSRSDKTLNLEGINKALTVAAAEKNWKLSNATPGQATATLVVRGKHTIIVDISYTTTELSLKYKDSNNMHYHSDINGNVTIHPNYNKWVSDFIKAINKELLNY